jgi:hypothetical protein
LWEALRPRKRPRGAQTGELELALRAGQGVDECHLVQLESPPLAAARVLQLAELRVEGEPPAGEAVDLVGFGRSVVSEKAAPILFANRV